jgi:hypothetical protein
MPLCTDEFVDELKGGYVQGTQVFCADEPITIPQLAALFGISIELLINTNHFLINTGLDEDISGEAYFIPPANTTPEQIAGGVPTFLPVPPYSEIQAQEEAERERQRQLQAATNLVEEQESDRTEPLTQADVNRLLAEIATAEHYARMVELAQTPQMLISDALLLPEQDIPDNVTEDARRQWMIRHLMMQEQNPAIGGYFAWSGLVAAGLFDVTNWTQFSNEELEEQMKNDILIPRLLGLIASRCQFPYGVDSLDICTEIQNLTLEALSLEELVNLGIGLEQIPGSLRTDSLGLFQQYYSDVDEARIEELLRDWNQPEERLLLDELNVAIQEIPVSIWDVSLDTVIAEVTDYYGRMEARHQMLSEIVAPRQVQEAAEQQRLQDKRDLYLEYINIGVEEGTLENRDWENQSYRTLYDAAHEVARDQRYFNDFLERYVEIEDGDPYRGLRDAGATALFILSLIPVVGTAADIVDGLIQLARGNLIGASLSFLGPLGDAIRPLQRLGLVEDVATTIIQHADDTSDIIHRAKTTITSRQHTVSEIAENIYILRQEIISGYQSPTKELFGTDRGQFRNRRTGWRTLWGLWGEESVDEHLQNQFRLIENQAFHEYAAIYNSNGQLQHVFRAIGTSIVLPEGTDLTNMTLLHNHPLSMFAAFTNNPNFDNLSKSPYVIPSIGITDGMGDIPELARGNAYRMYFTSPTSGNQHISMTITRQESGWSNDLTTLPSAWLVETRRIMRADGRPTYEEVRRMSESGTLQWSQAELFEWSVAFDEAQLRALRNVGSSFGFTIEFMGN